jgi:hypothetical protein
VLLIIVALLFFTITRSGLSFPCIISFSARMVY